MEILKDIIAIDLFLYLKKHNALVISDIHIGYEESLNRRGILIPRNNYSDLMLRLERALEKLKDIKQIIINGDIIHEFGKLSRNEKELTNKLIVFLKKYAPVTIIEGNHDKILRYILRSDVKIVKNIILGDIMITHGDKIEKNLKDIKTIIIGHEHPAVVITSGLRVEKYKCFLKGRYDWKNLIVTPSCNILIEGTNVLNERLLSPYLKKGNIKNFEAYIVEDKIYDFGKLKDLPEEN